MFMCIYVLLFIKIAYISRKGYGDLRFLLNSEEYILLSEKVLGRDLHTDDIGICGFFIRLEESGNLAMDFLVNL